PKVWAAASVPMLGSLLPVGDPASEAVELLPLLPHAARPRAAPSAIAAIPVRRISRFMVWSLHLVSRWVGRWGGQCRAFTRHSWRRPVRMALAGDPAAATTSRWMPEAPSGYGVARTGVCT